MISCNPFKLLYNESPLNLPEEIRHLTLTNPETHDTEKTVFVTEFDNGDVLAIYKNDLKFLHGTTLVLDGTFKDSSR